MVIGSAQSLLATAHQRLDPSRRQAGDGARDGEPALHRPALSIPDREAMLPDLVEPLTAEEQELLDLLAQRFSNREIGTTLCLSWNSVAKITNELYQKLCSTRRPEAVGRVVAFGIPAGRVGTGGGTPSRRPYVLPPPS